MCPRVNYVHFCNIFKIWFGAFDFVNASPPLPPPSPPPFLAKLRTAQGLVRNLARKGGGEGGKFQRGHRTLLAPLCHHLCPFFFYCFCMLSCYFFTCPIYNILLHLLSHHIMHLKP